MVGALLLLQSLPILAMLHPSQLLHHRFSLVADVGTGCRVVNVVLHNKVYDENSNAIRPICSGYVHFHSVEFVSQQNSSFGGLSRLVALPTYFENLKSRIKWNDPRKKSWHRARFKLWSLEENFYETSVLPLS